MKSLIVVLLLFTANLLVAQSEMKPRYAPRGEKHRNKTDELGRKQGNWKFYSEAGNIVWEAEYLDDIRHGVSKRYYSGGRIMRETTYEYGVKEGIYKRYYLNGQLKQEGQYESNKRTGVWSSWFSSGNMQNEGSYIKGFKDGIWKYYNQKGEIVNTIAFVKGRDQKQIEEEQRKAQLRKQQELMKKKSVGKAKIQPAIKGNANDTLKL